MKPVLPWYLQPSAKGLFKSGCLFFFSLPFLAGGIACFWGMCGRPVTDWWRARSWEPADAVVRKAWLEVNTDGDGDTYKVAAEFTYHYQGRQHRGNLPSFVHNSTNVGVSGMRETISRLPQGKAVTCWVNPDNPAEAVIDRSLPGEAVVGFFFSLPFLAVGTAGLCIPALPWLRHRLRHRRLGQLLPLTHADKLPAWVMDPFKNHKDAARENTTTLVIASDERVTATLGLTFFNLFWNGIVAVFVCVAVIFFMNGEFMMATLLSLFLTPFIAIGGVGLWHGFKQWRLIGRPRWAAAIRPVPGLEGGLAEFCWAWMDASRLAFLPRASIRLVALARLWDEESSQPATSLGSKRRAQVSDPAAAHRSELELAEVEIPSPDARSGVLSLQFPEIAGLQARLAGLPTGKQKRLAASPWGAWWQLEVTYADGEVETAKMTEPVKL